MLETFHFLNPEWFWALLPLAFMLAFVWQSSASSNPWKRVVDERLLALLMQKQSKNRLAPLMVLLGVSGLLGLIALANPVWEKLPQPVFETNLSRVIVLDLSQSMTATDVSPSRITRAHFKVKDILALPYEGQTGLVVFAGDAFVVTPLTRDAKTMEALLPTLEPSLMPLQGSRADKGLLQARKLLKQAGLNRGDILLITDGYEGDDDYEAVDSLTQAGFRVSVLAVGTEEGGEVLSDDGRPYATESGPVVATLNLSKLQEVAKKGRGKFSKMTVTDADLSRVVLDATGSDSQEAAGLLTEKWKDNGAWIALLMLPLVALLFRRGWLLTLVLSFGVMGTPQPSYAFEFADLWQRADQRADKALSAGQLDEAAKIAVTPSRKGAAEYRRGNFDEAAKAYEGSVTADGHYNRGNALAKLGRYEEAIKSYDEALSAVPEMEDAQVNRDAVKKLLEQQQNSENQDNSEKGDEQKNSQDESSEESGEEDQKSEQEGEPDSSQNANNEFDDAADQLDKEQEDKEKNEGAEENEPNVKPDEEAPEKAGKEEGAQIAENDESNQDAESENAQAKPLSTEEQIAAEQWLRRIPDDPGELLRRKFMYQYKERANRSGEREEQPW